MSRFSSKAIEIMRVLVEETDYKRAATMLEEMDKDDLLNYAWVKIWMAFYQLLELKFNKMLSILNEIDEMNKDLNDEFIQFFIDTTYVWYYSGWGFRITDNEKVDEYLEKVEYCFDKIDCLDDWEKYLIEARYQFAKFQYERASTGDPRKIIIHVERWIEALGKNPINGEYFKNMFGYNFLATYKMLLGEFEYAEKLLYKVISATSNNENLYKRNPYNTLIDLNILKGNFEEALNINDQNLQIADKYNNSFDMAHSLAIKSNIKFSMGEYEEAIQLSKESIEIKKKYGVPIVETNGYLFHFAKLMTRYELTKDENYLNKAKEIFEEIERMRTEYPEDDTIKYISELTQAELKRHGSMRDKVKAMEILEKLSELTPHEPNLWLTLAILYFEDYLLSEDEIVANKIDEIILKLENIKIINNPKIVGNYFLHQSLIAKYHFYVKGDPDAAIKILQNSKDKLETYKIKNIMDFIDDDIIKLKHEITKWDNVSYTLKERIKESKINDYIQLALNVAKQQ
ncbi:MAG: hypothetical protein GPJ54_22675 [Candidatus Heimdallarchaeota archaeon]|nr:hypothetical protein [Candidatus Heimdallarchaeota archaeon]